MSVRNTPYNDFPIVKYLSGRANYPRLLQRAIDEGRVDVAFVYSVFINGTATVRICHRYKIPVVYRVLDAYHKLRQSPWTMLPLYLGERYIYRNADIVCLTNEKMRFYVDNIAGSALGDRARVLEHGVDTDLFRPLPRDSELAESFGIAPNDRVALFVGTLYPFSGVDDVLRVFDVLSAECAQAKVVVVGGGALMEPLRALVAKNSLGDRVLLTGVRPYDEIPRWLSLANVTFNSFHINDITRDIVPIKMLQYLAAKPVVSAPIPDVMRLFPERVSGIIYRDISNAEDFAKTLGALLRDSDEAQALGRAGRELSLRERSLNGTIDQLEGILRSAALVSA